MDTVITIRPFDLENVVMFKESSNVPATNRQVQIKEEIVNKLSLFNREQKGVISKSELEKIKPSEEEFSPINVINKLAKSVALAAKSGYKELDVSKEEFEKLIDSIFNTSSKVYNEELLKKDKTIKDQADKIRMLEVKQKLLEVAINQANNEEEMNKII